VVSGHGRQHPVSARRYLREVRKAAFSLRQLPGLQREGTFSVIAMVSRGSWSNGINESACFYGGSATFYRGILWRKLR
jgi:hypothetical protein